MSSPDYIDHFYSLDPLVKEKLVADQSNLYKGINQSLINAIYDALYYKELDNNGPSNFQLHTNCELQDIAEINSNAMPPEKLALQFHHATLEQSFVHQTGALILATGYKNFIPVFLNGVKNNIQWIKTGPPTKTTTLTAMLFH